MSRYFGDQRPRIPHRAKITREVGDLRADVELAYKRVQSDVDGLQDTVDGIGASAPQEDLILAVSTSGSDDSTEDRPARLYGGDYSAHPFATIQAAIDACGKNRDFATQINVGAGDFAGFNIEGIVNSRPLTIEGVLGTPIGPFTVTGLNNRVSLEIARESWADHELRGYFLEVLSGPGAGKEEVVYENGLTNIEITSPVGQIGVGSVFQLVPIATTIASSDTGSDYLFRIASLAGAFMLKNIELNGPTIDWMVSCIVDSPASTVAFDHCVFDSDSPSWDRTSIVGLNCGIVVFDHVWLWEIWFDLFVGTDNKEKLAGFIYDTGLPEKSIYVAARDGFYCDNCTAEFKVSHSRFDYSYLSYFQRIACFYLWCDESFEIRNAEHVYFNYLYGSDLGVTKTQHLYLNNYRTFAATGQNCLTLGQDMHMTAQCFVSHQSGQDPTIRIGRIFSPVPYPYEYVLASFFSTPSTKVGASGLLTLMCRSDIGVF